MFNPQMILQFRQFMNNPQAMLKKIGVPQDIQGNPQAIIQHLMDNGKITQSDYNIAVQNAKQFQQMYGKIS